MTFFIDLKTSFSMHESIDMASFIDRRTVFSMRESKTLKEQNETLTAIIFNPYCKKTDKKSILHRAYLCFPAIFR